MEQDDQRRERRRLLDVVDNRRDFAYERLTTLTTSGNFNHHFQLVHELPGAHAVELDTVEILDRSGSYVLTGMNLEGHARGKDLLHLSSYPCRVSGG